MLDNFYCRPWPLRARAPIVFNYFTCAAWLRRRGITKSSHFVHAAGLTDISLIAHPLSINDHHYSLVLAQLILIHRILLDNFICAKINLFLANGFSSSTYWIIFVMDFKSRGNMIFLLFNVMRILWEVFVRRVTFDILFFICFSRLLCKWQLLKNSNNLASFW